MRNQGARLVLGILLSVVGPMGQATADEIWTCTFTSSLDKSPMLVSYRLEKGEVVEHWASGTSDRFRLVKNNDYGLIGISAIAAIEAAHAKPTVGASTLVINKQTKEFWLTTAITGQPDAVNAPAHGTCLKD